MIIGEQLSFAVGVSGVETPLSGVFQIDSIPSGVQNRGFRIIVTNDGEAPVRVTPRSYIAGTPLEEGTSLVNPDTGVATSVTVQPGSSKSLEFYAQEGVTHFGFSGLATLGDVPGNPLQGEHATRQAKVQGTIKFAETRLLAPLDAPVPNN